MARVYGSDGLTTHPDLIISKPATVCLQGTEIILTMSATVFAVVTDASGYTTLFQQQTSAQGGFTINNVAGTVTVPRAMTVRVTYMISGITVINGSTRQSTVFGGAAGTTAQGGDSFATDLTASPSTLRGVTVFAAAAGDIISVKAIESGAGTMTVLDKGLTLLVEEV